MAIALLPPTFPLLSPPQPLSYLPRVTKDDTVLLVQQQAIFEIQKLSLSKWGQVHNISFENGLYLHETNKIIFISMALLIHGGAYFCNFMVPSL